MGQNQENVIINATKVLMDKDNERILLCTHGRARSALEIHQLYGIPIAACFKKIRALEKIGLLEAEEITYFQNGEKEILYRANLQNAYVFYDSGKLKVRFEVVLQMTSGIRRRLESSQPVYSENIGTEIHA